MENGNENALPAVNNNNRPPIICLYNSKISSDNTDVEEITPAFQIEKIQ